jgi:hypothetical protein
MWHFLTGRKLVARNAAHTTSINARLWHCLAQNLNPLAVEECHARDVPPGRLRSGSGGFLSQKFMREFRLIPKRIVETGIFENTRRRLIVELSVFGRSDKTRRTDRSASTSIWLRSSWDQTPHRSDRDDLRAGLSRGRCRCRGRDICQGDGGSGDARSEGGARCHRRAGFRERLRPCPFWREWVNPPAADCGTNCRWSVPCAASRAFAGHDNHVRCT